MLNELLFTKHASSIPETDQLYFLKRMLGGSGGTRPLRPEQKDLENPSQLLRAIHKDETLADYVIGWPVWGLAAGDLEQDEYLAQVGLLLKDPLPRIGLVASLNKRVFRIFRQMGGGAHFRGLQLTLACRSDDQLQGVLRLTVSRDSLEQAENLSPESMKQPHPFRGCSCELREPTT